mmetsp:Transcript_13072/g.14973  ORF Transcript_13072/g.14973 Transcript_13072/m.14973 type:complete len:179 (-) Transcript_13072:195-731(-)
MLAAHERNNYREPKLPRVFWGKIIYVTPGSGKTYVANKYRKVVDADDLIVESIQEVCPGFDYDSYYGECPDPRKYIFRFYRYNSTTHIQNKVYARTRQKMINLADEDYVILLGSTRLMHMADLFLLQDNQYIVRKGFSQLREQVCDEVESSINFRLDGFLEPWLQNPDNQEMYSDNLF